MSTTFLSRSIVRHNRNAYNAPAFRAKPFALLLNHTPPAIMLLCLLLVIGLCILPLWLVPIPLSGQLVGRWQMQTLTRQGRRTPLSGEYEFRSDYSTRRITGVSGTRAGMWIIRAPIESAEPATQILPQNAIVITSTYQFIATLTNHIDVRIRDRQGTLDETLWPGPGIYEITIINDQLVLRIPDRETGGWIVIECTKAPEAIPMQT